MQTGDALRVGIIGGGFISGYHIVGLKAAGADVPVVASLSAESAARKAAEFAIPESTDDYRRILERSDIDAVVIATPDFTHRDIALEAIAHRKPLMLQKPMARSSAECQEIIDAARRANVPLYVSFMHRYFDEVLHARTLLEQNALGRIFSIRQRNATPGAGWASWFYSRENVGGGAMMQLGVHGVDLLRHLFGEIDAVKATTALLKTERRLEDGTLVHPDNEDLVFAVYRLRSGALVTHEVAYNEVAGTDRFRMEIYGEAGTAWLRTERGLMAVYAPAFYGREGWVTPDIDEMPLGLRHHRHFLDMVRGNAPDDHSAHDGWAAIRVIEAVYRSAESGNWEEVGWQ